MNSKTPKFFPGLLIGFFLGITAVAYWKTGWSMVASVIPALPAKQTESSLIRCASQVNTSQWKMFRDFEYGIEIRYPSSYAIKKEGAYIVLSEQSSLGPSIKLEKFKGPLRKEIVPEMHQAGWKIADRQTYALTSSPFTNPDGTLQAMYLFVRDFPFHENTGTYTMVRATLSSRMSSDLFRKARQEGIIDPEIILTEPEQVLSTFRFLQYNELPGRDN